MMLKLPHTVRISHKKQVYFGVDNGGVAEQRHATSRSHLKVPKLPIYPFSPFTRHH